jgi:oligopeptide transport system substrate-binding protein
VNRSALGLLVGLSLLASACQSSPPPVQFDAAQVLRLVAPQDVITLDPATIHQPSVGLSLARNVFGGLYQFRDDLVEIPDLATGPPEISPDGLSWTFHLNATARFSNGTPVTAGDVLYSWNRVARLNPDDYQSASIFESVQGYADVQAGRATMLSGLTEPDDHTVKAQLTAPAGYWLVELGLWAAAVVEKDVVTQRGEATWWTTPDGLIGTGPFRMIARDAGKSLDFEPVANWWRGSTGRLKHVHVDVIKSEAAQVSGYRSGAFDIMGYTPSDVIDQFSDELMKSLLADKDLSPELHMHAAVQTFVVGFRGEGRLGTPANVAVRRALSLSLDRTKLAQICIQGGTCTPADGGLITKGLAGYLGDGADLNAKHDLSAAKALLHSWDPTGSRLGVLRVGAGIPFRSMAQEITAEWHSALGLDVQLEVGEFQSVGANARSGHYDVVVNANYADYDSPYNWFSSVTDACHAAFVNPHFMSLVEAANKKPPGDAVGDYKRAGQLLADDADCLGFAYLQNVQLIKPWVQGAGSNALYENYWRSVSILKH